MNKVSKIIIIILAVAIIYLAGGIGYDIGFEKGYEQGYSDTPINVLALEELEISLENGKYYFTATSGNHTITVAKIPGNKLELWEYENE